MILFIVLYCWLHQFTVWKKLILFASHNAEEFLLNISIWSWLLNAKLSIAKIIIKE